MTGCSSFPGSKFQETADEAKAAGVNLHPLLHCGIETMGRNERATFVVTDGFGNSAEKKEADSNTTTEVPPQRRFEYDISLDDWTEEIDLSERQDSSLVKRVIRDGDAVTRPVDIGGVTVRCVSHLEAYENLEAPAAGEPGRELFFMVTRKDTSKIECEARCGANFL